jgi:3-oxoacyl-[acyl-carrier protein] reductase
MKLNGKTALVTGGSKGIGAAVARRLAYEGADIILTYTKSANKAAGLLEEIDGMGRKARLLRVEGAEQKVMKQLVSHAISELGRIDILVNNANVVDAQNTLGEIDEAKFNRVLAVNVTAPFWLTQETVKVMQGGGRIINVSSVMGVRGILPKNSPYSMTRFALVGMTRAWAHDLAPRNITCNAILPGFIQGDVNPDIDANPEAYRKMTPAGRLGKPDDVAGLVAWLAGPESGFVTGACFTVDGGVNA